jgi:hypothetical protein
MTLVINGTQYVGSSPFALKEVAPCNQCGKMVSNHKHHHVTVVRDLDPVSSLAVSAFTGVVVGTTLVGTAAILTGVGAILAGTTALVAAPVALPVFALYALSN